MTTAVEIFKKVIFNLESPLSTINVIKIQDDVWKTIENGNHLSFKNDSEIVEMVERLENKGFELKTPYLKY